MLEEARAILAQRSEDYEIAQNFDYDGVLLGWSVHPKATGEASMNRFGSVRRFKTRNAARKHVTRLRRGDLSR